MLSKTVIEIPLETRRNMFKYAINNEGGTFTADGKDTHYANGFMVSITDHIIPAEIRAFHRAVKDLAKQLPDGGHIGLYVETNPKTKEKTICVDISLHVATIQEAQALGVKYNQRAIWDCGQATTIDVDYGKQIDL